MENEKRLIAADALKDHVNSLSTHWLNDWSTIGVLAAIDRQITVDAVEVVRCKDCKHMELTPYGRWCNAWFGINGMGDEGFCNYGERKCNNGFK